MKVLNWADMVRRFGDDMRFRLVSLVILATGALLVISAFGVGVVGGFLWLSTVMPNHLAALVVAGGLFLTGAIIIAFALSRGPRHAAPVPVATGRGEADMEVLAEQIMRSALANTKETPFKAVLGAVVLGLAVGLLREKKPQ